MTRPRFPWMVVALALTLGAAIAASLIFGARGVLLPSLAELMADPASRSPDATVLWQQRVPRTLAGVAAGVGLGLAGVLTQSMTRNRLADPGLLGVAPGAAFAVTVAVAWNAHLALRDQMWVGLVGAGVVTSAVYLLGRKASPARLVLAGVAIGSVFSGLSSAIALRNPDAFDRMRRWGAGALGGRSIGDIVDFVPFAIVGIPVCFALARSLDLLELGDDTASMLGLNVTTTRAMITAAVALLVGSATALVGPVSFVGLIIPHLMHPFAGARHARLLLLTALASPTLVLGADVLGRTLPLSGELPVGIVTALLGGTMLALLVGGRQWRART